MPSTADVVLLRRLSCRKEAGINSEHAAQLAFLEQRLHPVFAPRLVTSAPRTPEAVGGATASTRVGRPASSHDNLTASCLAAAQLSTLSDLRRGHKGLHLLLCECGWILYSELSPQLLCFLPRSVEVDWPVAKWGKLTEYRQLGPLVLPSVSADDSQLISAA